MIAGDLAAALLWSNKGKVPVTSAGVRGKLTTIYDLIANPLYKWEMHIGHLIPRDPQFISFGGECLTTGDIFYDQLLEFWFDIHRSQKTKQAIANESSHSNLLVFAVVIIQLAAVIVIMEEEEESTLLPSVANKFPNGFPKLANLMIRTDNSPSQNLAHKVLSRSEQGQQMIHIYAALLEHTSLAVSCAHIAGKDNSLADFISRPPTKCVISGIAPSTDIIEGAETRIVVSIFLPKVKTSYHSWNQSYSPSHGR